MRSTESYFQKVIRKRFLGSVSSTTMSKRFIAIFLLSTVGAVAQSVIYNGQGFATEYYNLDNPHVCNYSYDSMNEGYVSCSPMKALSLNEINSSYVVAMNNTLLHTDLSLYCGKKVVVSVNGKPSSLPFFVGDGCGRCSLGPSTSQTWDPQAAPGIDLSHDALQALSGNACQAGHVEISWEVLDEQVYQFNIGILTDTAATSFRPSPSPGTPTRGETGLATSGGPAQFGLCVDNTWRCDGNVLEQCIGSAWTPRVTCAAGTSCNGDSNPYCR